MPNIPQEDAGVRERNAAAVLGAIRAEGPLCRAAIARHTALSMPTVSRQVGTLIGLDLLHELHAPPRGAVGRPRTPVDLNEDGIAACGVHIGVSTTTYGLTSLRGRLLDTVRMPTPRGQAATALGEIAATVGEYLRERPGHRVIGVGVATGGQVDAERGVVTHERLGWAGAEVRDVLARGTGLPVHVDGHVPAMAEAELLFGAAGRAPSALYFYARQVVGTAVAVHGRLHRGPGQASSVAHLPVGGDVRCRCGRTGCLEATVAEDAVAERAVAHGVIERPDIRLLHAAAAAGKPAARAALIQRARAIGRAVGLLRDVVDPDLVVLGGQAVTDAPEYLPELRASFAQTTGLPGTGLVQVTRFGQDVQAMAACTGLLTRLYTRPLSSVPAVPPSPVSTASSANEATVASMNSR